MVPGQRIRTAQLVKAYLQFTSVCMRVCICVGVCVFHSRIQIALGWVLECNLSGAQSC